METDIRPFWTVSTTGSLLTLLGLTVTCLILFHSPVTTLVVAMTIVLLLPWAVALVSTEQSLRLTEVTFYIIWTPVSVLMAWAKLFQNEETPSRNYGSKTVPYIRVTLAAFATTFDLSQPSTALTSLTLAGTAAVFSYIVRLTAIKIMEIPKRSILGNGFIKKLILLSVCGLYVTVSLTVVKLIEVNLANALAILSIGCLTIVRFSGSFVDSIEWTNLGIFASLEEEVIIVGIIVLDIAACFFTSVLAYQQSCKLNYATGLVNFVFPLLNIYHFNLSDNEEWKAVFRKSQTLSSQQVRNLDDVCPICLTKMSSAKLTSCGHVFHHACLKRCLRRKLNCPICRKCLCLSKTCPTLISEARIRM